MAMRIDKEKLMKQHKIYGQVSELNMSLLEEYLNPGEISALSKNVGESAAKLIVNSLLITYGIRMELDTTREFMSFMVDAIDSILTIVVRLSKEVDDKLLNSNIELLNQMNADLIERVGNIEYNSEKLKKLSEKVEKYFFDVDLR